MVAIATRARLGWYVATVVETRRESANAATVVFDLFANLFASVLLYIALDRVFNNGID